MKTVEYTFKVPTYLLPPIVNSDFDCLSKHEESVFEDLQSTELDLIKENSGSHGTWSFEEEEYFTWNPDFDNLGGNVVNGTLTVFIP